MNIKISKYKDRSPKSINNFGLKETSPVFKVPKSPNCLLKKSNKILSYPSVNDMNTSYEKGSKRIETLYKHSSTAKKQPQLNYLVKLDNIGSDKGFMSSMSQERSIYKGYGR